MWRILYYEDDVIEHEVIKGFVTEIYPNEKLEVFKTSHQFMQQLQEIDEQKSILLLDISIKPYAGDYIAETIRAKYPDLVIFAVTGDTDNPNNWQRYGFNGVICKPVNWERFMSLLGEVFQDKITNEWHTVPPIC
jgi:response regulator of citrate/malate metabolism